MSAEDCKEPEEGHVKFVLGNEEGHKSRVTVQKVDDENLQAHIGFLKVSHRYEVEIPLQLPLTDIQQLQPDMQSSVAIQGIKLMASPENPDIANVLVELVTYKAKLLREKICLKNPTTGKKLVITVNARVLGTCQGTPMLLDGVRLVGALPVDDSELSDWQGFE